MRDKATYDDDDADKYVARTDGERIAGAYRRLQRGQIRLSCSSAITIQRRSLQLIVHFRRTIPLHIRPQVLTFLVAQGFTLIQSSQHRVHIRTIGAAQIPPSQHLFDVADLATAVHMHPCSIIVPHGDNVAPHRLIVGRDAYRRVRDGRLRVPEQCGARVLLSASAVD